MGNSTEKRITVALLDDHFIVLHGLSDMLTRHPSFCITGRYTTSRELLASLSCRPVDVVIVDYQLSPSDVDGLNLLKMLHRLYPQTAVLVISAHYNPATVALALRAGARGFVGKNRPEADLQKAVTEVSAGRLFIEPEMAQEMALQQDNGQHLLRGQISQDNVNKATSLSRLSPKEQEVIRCFLSGMTVNEISAKFSRSKKTVSGQKSSALRKLGLRADHELFIIKDELLKTIGS